MVSVILSINLIKRQIGSTTGTTRDEREGEPASLQLSENPRSVEVRGIDER